jgi:hypothetical protein
VSEKFVLVQDEIVVRPLPQICDLAKMDTVVSETFLRSIVRFFLCFWFRIYPFFPHRGISNMSDQNLVLGGHSLCIEISINISYFNMSDRYLCDLYLIRRVREKTGYCLLHLHPHYSS